MGPSRHMSYGGRSIAGTRTRPARRGLLGRCMKEGKTVNFSLPDTIRNAASIADAARLLGVELGLAGPAPEIATRRAIGDPLYSRALLASRKIPQLRDKLLAEPGATRINAAPESALSSVGLAGRVAAGLLRWGMEGLKPADPWVIEKRLAACNSCEFQAPAPDTLIYRGAKVVAGRDAKICTSCHCLTNTKAAISTEHCPEHDPRNSELSRWGEPWVPSEKHPKGPW